MVGKIIWSQYSFFHCSKTVGAVFFYNIGITILIFSQYYVYLELIIFLIFEQTTNLTVCLGSEYKEVEGNFPEIGRVSQGLGQTISVFPNV